MPKKIDTRQITFMLYRYLRRFHRMAGDPKDREFWADMLARVRKRTYADQDAEDLLHSAWLRLFAYRTEHEVKQPAAFMVQTASNLAIDRHRRTRHTSAQSIEAFSTSLEDNSPLQDEVLEARERLRRVQAGLDKLPPRTREVFVMHRVQGMKLREISAALGITQSAVEKHVAKAVLFLTEWTDGW
ncbi:MAG TPA: sigma-70 family RNA polymerase sigma factor [Rhizomicrobium sp.]|jgi:RNA polymerase sigma-70 factor (ECF subfamily)|nr:sigma-70 family RNA polymerase sigma factor [Rhizomicrobium sp.]